MLLHLILQCSDAALKCFRCKPTFTNPDLIEYVRECTKYARPPPGGSTLKWAPQEFLSINHRNATVFWSLLANSLLQRNFPRDVLDLDHCIDSEDTLMDSKSISFPLATRCTKPFFLQMEFHC